MRKRRTIVAAIWVQRMMNYFSVYDGGNACVVNSADVTCDSCELC
jgi:hypothetical protein